MVSRAARSETILPKPTMSMNQIIKIFSNIGLSVQEMVALTGAHTIGFSHCSEISHDIYNYSRTQMSDPSYNTRYADGLRNACKDFKKNPSLSVFNDIMTPHDFDNSYYKNLPKGLGVLRSDRAMMMDVRTRKYVELYARDQKAFFDAFGRAIEKLSLVGVKSGEPKRKKAKKDVFTVNLYYDGLFTSCPMIYFQGQCKGHNKASCKKDPQPKPEVEKKPPGRNKQVFMGQCASKGGGRSGRGDGNDGSDSGSGVNDASGSGVNAGSASGVTDGSGSSGRGGGRAGGRGGGRAGGSGGRGKRGGGRAGRGSERGGVFPSSSSCGILTAEQEYQLELDEQAFRECMEEQAREQAKIDAEQEKLDKERREEQEWEEKNDYFNPANWQEESMEEAPMNQQYHEVFIPSIHSQPTQQSGVWVVDTTVSVADVDEAPEQDKGKAKATVEDGPAPEQGKSPAVDKGKTKASVEDGPAPKKKRGRPPSSVDGIRIYHKNRGRSERIANMKLNKPFQFDKFGTGSTPDKAFDVEE
ncbi:peroxidase 31-like protein [Tanacetum coccineum]